MITGDSTSFTVTLNEQLTAFPAGSIAFAVTSVVPTGKNVPGFWLQVITDEQLSEIAAAVSVLTADLRKLNVTVKFDDRTTQKPGFKFAEWELKGVPVRIAVGPKDLENGTFEVARRDTLTKEIKEKEGIAIYIKELLEQIQNDLFDKALSYRNNHITEVNDFEEFKQILEDKGGFVSAHWDGTAATEEKIKDMTKATIRCIPLDAKEEVGTCVFTGNPSSKRVLFAKAY